MSSHTFPITTRGERTARAVSIIGVMGAALLAADVGAVEAKNWILLHRDLSDRKITPVAIKENQLAYHQSADSDLQHVHPASALALFDENAAPQSSGRGLLRLNDGQQFPGRILSNAQPDSQVVVWNHDWLGRMEIPLDTIGSIVLDPEAAEPEPGTADVVRLNNGDRLEGFLTQIGDPISIELTNDEGSEVIDVPLQAVSAIVMVNREQPPQGQRLWLGDGTVVRVEQMRLEHDGQVHAATPWTGNSSETRSLELAQVAAIQFDAGAMIPLADLRASRVEGPLTRYVTPSPTTLDPTALLGLSPIEYRGPVVMHYALPADATRLAGTARVPASAVAWADFELIIRVDDSEVFRTRLNADRPRAAFNVALHGSELTVEITEGANGPVLDHVILERAVLRLGQE